MVRPTSLPYPRALCIPQTCAVQLHAQHDTSPHGSPYTCVTFLMRVHTTGNVKRSSNASSIKETSCDILINDRAARQRLNQLVQPWIALRLLGALVYQFSLGTSVVVVDAPLLYETGLHRLCSVVVVVSVD